MNKNKLKEILAILSPDGTEVDFKAFDEGVDKLKSGLKQKIQVKTLEDVNGQLARFKQGLDLEPLFTAIKDIDKNFDSRIKQVASALAEEVSKFDELSKVERGESAFKIAESAGTVDSLRNELDTLRTQKDKEFNDLTEALKSIPKFRADSEVSFNDIKTRLEALEVPEGEEPDLITPVAKRVEEVRTELISKMANTRHGDHANRNIAIGGNTSVLSRYTDINLIAGSNITLNAVPNQTTKYTDLTLTASGGGSGTPSIGGGITGGVDQRVLFVHPASIIAQDANLTFTSAGGLSTNVLTASSTLTVNGPSGHIGASSQSIGNPPAQTWFEVVGNDNTTAGVSLIIDNTNTGTSAYQDLFFGNSLSQYAVVNLNSTTYSDTSFGTAYAVANQLSLQNLGGPILIGASGSSQYINFVVGGTNTNNEVARLTTNNFTVGLQGSVAGTIKLPGATGGATNLSVPSVAGNYTFVLPPNTGSNSNVLQTDGNGVTSWGTAGGGGISRTASVISVSSTFAATAKTDYVAFANVGIQLTLPTAIGNSNLYTVKNASNSSVLVATTNSETIDGSTSALIVINNQTLGFMSNGSVWGVI